jgi:hypothetical protein
VTTQAASTIKLNLLFSNFARETTGLGDETLSAGDKVADWSLYTETAPTDSEPLRKHHVQEM